MYFFSPQYKKFYWEFIKEDQEPSKTTELCGILSEEKILYIECHNIRYNWVNLCLYSPRGEFRGKKCVEIKSLINTVTQ